MCSYNDYGKGAKGLVRNQVKSEKINGNSYLNHLILRDKSENIDNVKFNFLLDDLPIMTYSLMNLYKSKIKNVAVVGNLDSKRIFEKFIDFYNVNQKYDRFKFMDEGNNLSLSNTLIKGKSCLEIEDNDLSLLLPGDIPLFYDLEGAINDPSTISHDCILNLNTKDSTGVYFPRNYHLRVDDGKKIHEIKEPNFYLLNLNKVDLGILDIFYGGRKTYSNFDQKDKSLEKGRGYAIKERFFSNGKWKKTLNSLRGNYCSFLLPLVFNKSPLLKLNTLESLVDQGIGLNSKLNLNNNDPGTIEDIDSLEDWAYLNQMFIESKKDKNNRHKFYPYYKTLNKFKGEPMKDLRNELILYKNYDEHMNNLFRNFGLLERGYYSDGKSFLLNKPYSEGNLNLNFSKYFVKDMIVNNVKNHKNFFDKISK